MIQLVHAFVLSHIDYGNALLVGLPATRLANLQRVQNSAARLIMGVSRCESITPVLRSLHWLPVCQRIEFNIAVQVFRCLVGLAPQYHSALISLRDAGRESRSSFQLLLFSPRSHMKSFGNRAFLVTSPRIWNSLPPDLRSIALFPYSPLFSLTQFRCKLKTFLFRTAYENSVSPCILSEPIAPLIMIWKRRYSILNAIHYHYYHYSEKERRSGSDFFRRLNCWPSGKCPLSHSRKEEERKTLVRRRPTKTSTTNTILHILFVSG